jgi:hypothetical protein
MIIQSDDRRSSVEIDRVDDDDGRHFFRVSARADGHALTNPHVFLERTATFVEQLETFERRRSGSVLLAGTEDFRFTIEPDGRSGAIWIHLVLNNYFVTGGDRTGHARSGKMSLDMGFPVAGEHVGALVQQFKELLAD